MPSAMAPLDTTTKEASRRAAMASASRSKTPPSPASVRDPILTTTRRARGSWARGSAIGAGDELVERDVEAVEQPVGDARGDAEECVDQRRHRLALIVD